MKLRWASNPIGIISLAFLPMLVPTSHVGCQVDEAAVREAYFRAVGEHFDAPFQEVTIISEGGVSPDEVPVVVFLAQGAGISADALIALRRVGRPWQDVAKRFGLDTNTFHLPLPEGEYLGPLSRVYEEFRDRPVGEWSDIHLGDEDIIALVNLRVLLDRTGARPGRILRVREEAGSFLAAFPRLAPR